VQDVQMGKKSWLTLGALLAALPAFGQEAATGSPGDAHPLNRYTSVEARPALSVMNPLRVVVSVHFPKGHVQTVGDALRHLLVRTGYSLVAQEQLGAAEQHVLGLPLPESHRQLGPYRVEAMAQALLGEAWTLQVDAVRRTLGFVQIASAALAPINTTPTKN
jgi:conjugative transfer region protein (TIGR03748 family)